MAQVYRFRQGAEGVEAFHKKALLDKKDKKAKLVFNFDLTPREITEDQLSRPGGLLAISQTGYPYEIRGNTATINNAYRIEGEDAMTHQIRLMHTMMEAVMTLIDAGYETITLNGNPHTCLAAKQFIDEVINPNMPEGHKITVNWAAPESLPDNAEKWSDQYIQHVKMQKKIVLDKTDLVSNAIHNQLARRQVKAQQETKKHSRENKQLNFEDFSQEEQQAYRVLTKKIKDLEAQFKPFEIELKAAESDEAKKEINMRAKHITDPLTQKNNEVGALIQKAKSKPDVKQRYTLWRAKHVADAHQNATCAMAALKQQHAAEAEKTMPKPRPDSGQMGC